MPLAIVSGPLLLPDSYTHRFPAGIALQGVCFALLTTIVAVSLAVFIRREQKTMGLWVILGIILFLYACSIAEAALEMRLLIVVRSRPHVCIGQTCATIVDRATALHNVLAAASLEFVIVFINDCTVLWRAWAIWKRSKIVLVTSCLLAAATLALFITAIAMSAIDPPIRQSRQDTSLPLYLILVIASSIATNSYATILVVIRTWQCWCAIRMMSGPLPLPFKMLILLAESGFTYTLIWVVYIISLFSAANGFLAMNFYLNCIVPYICAMYPATVFILIGIRKSAQDEIFTSTVLESLSVPVPTPDLDTSIRLEPRTQLNGPSSPRQPLPV